MKGRRVLQHWNGNGEQRIRDQIQVKIKFSVSQPRWVLIIADVGSQMGRLATISVMQDLLELEHVCVKYVTVARSRQVCI
jgi:hypothetical protein